MSNHNIRSMAISDFFVRGFASKTLALSFALTCALGTAGYAQSTDNGSQYGSKFENTNVGCMLLNPKPNQKFTAPATITIEAAPFTKNKTTIKKVEFYVGDYKVGVAEAAPYSVVVKNLHAGSYNLKAKAYDDSGVAGDSATVRVEVTSATEGTAHLVATAPTITISKDGAVQVQLGIKNDGNGAARNVTIGSVAAYDDPSGRKVTVTSPKLPASIDRIDPGKIAPFSLVLNDVLPTSGYMFMIVNGSYVSGDKTLQVELAGGFRLSTAK